MSPGCSPPTPWRRTGRTLFRQWIEQVCGTTAGVYGRHIYEVMRHWNEDQPERTPGSRSLPQPGGTIRNGSYRERWRSSAYATLVSEDVEAVIRRLRSNWWTRLRFAALCWRRA